LETTLSSGRTVQLIPEAKRHGFTVGLVYICVPDAEIAVMRVGDRVVKGGHNIPEDTIRRRYERSLTNAAEAFRLADSAIVFDNSGQAPREVMTIEYGAVTWRAAALPPWLRTICQALSA
jgi:predicted ABC-type ATPase